MHFLEKTFFLSLFIRAEEERFGAAFHLFHPQKGERRISTRSLFLLSVVW
jgi:hypothetical protein